jgi:hypothetical protein
LLRRSTVRYSSSVRSKRTAADELVKEKVVQEQVLLEKIRRLPPDKRAELEDFVEFLNVRNEDRRLTEAASRLSEEAFRQVWGNEADAAYDKL